ncbi:unnamed protein product [Calicophoron daubneyi]|uniref:Uncharacterized protein n=1 Tax=Calicophoron daubneyi TaxID=300641 RepID=A0AAV2TE87_CALDB
MSKSGGCFQKEPTGGCLVLEEAKLKRIFNLSYELQSYFIASMTSSCPLKEELYKSGAASALCLSIFGAANSADKLDARASLPLWKLASSVMQQYKSEIRSYDCNQTPLKTEGLFFEQVLRLLLDSVGYFFKECEKSSKEAPPDVNLETSLNTKLKMLNLLTRIITFCIREFVSSSSPADLAPGNSAFIAWMKWMINIRFAGGLHASGTGIASKLVDSLESSIFLAIDIVISHLMTLAPDPQKNVEYSAAASILRNAAFTPAARCRIYGIIMAGLPQHSHCYPRWITDEFNLYAEFFNALSEVGTLGSGADQVDKNELSACADEFYVTLLKQFCASLCGLPAGCFFRLEQALLHGLLSKSPLTNLMVADIWCFLVRYGTGDLCWQYVTTFASTIDQLSKQLSSQTPANRKQNLVYLDRLGQLLSRWIIFLTPRQQCQFFQRYPLSHPNIGDSFDPAMCESSSILWRFVPLRIDRLQKSAQTMAKNQIFERLTELSSAVDEHPSGNDRRTHLLLEVSLSLHFADFLPASSLDPVVTTVTRLISYLFDQLRSDRPDNALGLGPLWLLDSLNQPVADLCNHLSHWIPSLAYRSLSASQQNSASDTLQMLLDAAVSSRPGEQVSDLVLGAFCTWLLPTCTDLLRDQAPASRQHNQWLRVLSSIVRSVKIKSSSSYHKMLTDSLEKCLPVVPELPSDSSSTIDPFIGDIARSIDRLEASLRPTSVWADSQLETLRGMSNRLQDIVNTMSERGQKG